jgi:hypothetical protein
MFPSIFAYEASTFAQGTDPPGEGADPSPDPKPDPSPLGGVDCWGALYGVAGAGGLILY